MTDQDTASERGADMQTAPGETRRHPSKPAKGLTYVDDALRNAYAALQTNDLDTFLRIHREHKIRPRIDSLIVYARRALWMGDLDHGLKALAAAGKTATHEDLIGCADAASDAGNEALAARALALAAKARR
jgi:hypothetical protein